MSKHSAQQVQQLIQNLQPNTVLLELCRHRRAILGDLQDYSEEEKEEDEVQERTESIEEEEGEEEGQIEEQEENQSEEEEDEVKRESDNSKPQEPTTQRGAGFLLYLLSFLYGQISEVSIPV